MTFPIHVQGLDGVSLVSPIDPEFDDVARPYLGRVANLAFELKPFLVIVSNESAQTVVSFSLIWRVTHESGRVTTFRSHTSFPHSVCGDVLVSRDPDALAPGAKRIEANGVVIHGWGNLDEYFDQFIPQFITEKDRTLAHAIELRIELNAAILDDGALLGPDDESWLSNNFSAYVQTKQDWYRDIIDALGARQSVAAAFSAVDEFSADFKRRIGSTGPGFQENPLELWKPVAAIEAQRWRRLYADDEIPPLLERSIRLEPFLIRRR
jgi:hypothetical protein